MPRQPRSKSTITVGLDEFLTKLTPFKGTPLTVQVGRLYAEGLAALGITFSTASTGAAATEESEGDETPAETRPTFRQD